MEEDAPRVKQKIKQVIFSQPASVPVSERYVRDRWAGFISQTKQGVLLIEGIPVDALLKEYGSPLYVMVESEIRRRFRRFKKVFGSAIGLQYAVKCNSNLEILKIAREEGFELDCSSIGEVILGLLADFQPRSISFTNLYKTEQDIHFAAQIGIQSVTADSLEEIERIAATAKKLKKHINTVIRVNPMLDVGAYSTKGNKYGIPITYVDRAMELVLKSPYVDFQGFHFMGGYVRHPRVFKAAARVFVKLIKRYQNKGIQTQSLSLGGGFPAAIGEETAFPIEDMSDFPAYFESLCQKNGIARPRLIFEPGKSIVLNAGIGLMQVVSKKRLGRVKRMVIADGSTYNFVPDALIQNTVTYDILPASKMNRRRVHTITVAGSTCDAWDLIAKEIEMPRLQAKDILAVMDIGAYAQVMSSNFNTIRRPSVVMVGEGGKVRQVRRRDRYSEMFAPELDVLKMADPDELEHYHNIYRVNIDKIWKGQKNGSKGNRSRS